LQSCEPTEEGAPDPAIGALDEVADEEQAGDVLRKPPYGDQIGRDAVQAMIVRPGPDPAFAIEKQPADRPAERSRFRLPHPLPCVNFCHCCLSRPSDARVAEPGRRPRAR
jgi:uncharacterized membrane protein